ncbi:MAG: ECF-type sigma factor [Pseudomonadaceae bacterium]|nr:ECF-type sigma factor [Pseudomonadaceae bacterium]
MSSSIVKDTVSVTKRSPTNTNCNSTPGNSTPGNSTNRASAAASDVTSLLHRWRAGDAGALGQAWPLLHAELARNARGLYAGENAGHTLQPTALVNEALIKLMGTDIQWVDRCHFLAVMTRSMRQVLIDYARAKRSDKRGGDAQRVELITNLTGATVATDVLDLDSALEALAALDARKADIVTMVYFGGMRYDEIATSLEISEATVTRDLRFARAWLKNQLDRRSNEDDSTQPIP